MNHSKQIEAQIAGAWRGAPFTIAPDLPELVGETMHESEAGHRANFARAPVPMLLLDARDVVTGVSDRGLDLL